MRRGAPDYGLLAIVGGLVLFGLVMLASATGPTGLQRFGDPYYFFKRQLLFGVLPGLALLVIASKISVERYKRLAPFALPAALLLLSLGFIPGLRAGYGSGSWINLFGVSFQPSEAAKLLLALYFAWWFARRDRETLRGLWTGFLPFVVSLGIVVSVMMLQSDLGTTSVIIALLFSMYVAAGAPMLHLGALAAAGAAMFYVFIKIASYRADRLKVFLRPDLDPQGVGYHINQALLAIGSGGWLGLGIGKSRQKFQYLPEVAGDSIFAVIAEETGFLISALFVFAFVLLTLRILRMAERVDDPFARYAAVGIAGWFGFQAVLNISAMVSLMPLTGVPLPFVSHGGSAMLANLAAVGVLLSISTERRALAPRAKG